MQFLVTNDDGSMVVKGHPGWRIGETPEDSRLLTDEELVEHGFGLMIVNEPPAFDPATQTRVMLPMSEWNLTETTATVTYAVTDMTLEEVRTNKLADLADKRWSVETGGTTVNGVPVRTDANSQAKITGAVSLFNNDPEMTSIDWEAQPGVWVTLDAATMKAIGIAVGRHVQACFSNAKAISAQIVAAATVADIMAIDLEAGWPS